MFHFSGGFVFLFFLLEIFRSTCRPITHKNSVDSRSLCARDRHPRNRGFPMLRHPLRPFSKEKKKRQYDQNHIRIRREFCVAIIIAAANSLLSMNTVLFYVFFILFYFIFLYKLTVVCLDWKSNVDVDNNNDDNNRSNFFFLIR